MSALGEAPSLNMFRVRLVGVLYDKIEQSMLLSGRGCVCTDTKDSDLKSCCKVQSHATCRLTGIYCMTFPNGLLSPGFLSNKLEFRKDRVRPPTRGILAPRDQRDCRRAGRE